ncbi:oxidoreductase [Corynebacterium sp. KPL2838]|uniref:oxidoreductase n=1 Tax=Corynebacterium sp. KPL2838 TaxID=3158316 RepID=UPI0032EDA511
MFNLFRRNKSRSPLRPPRGPGETIRPEDEQELKLWAADKAFVEAFIEPETVVNEMSVVVVDEKGECIRRRIGGPKGIDAVGKLLQCDVFDVEETGYPQRMRERMERQRILRKREEQRLRRARFERGENPDSGQDLS